MVKRRLTVDLEGPHTSADAAEAHLHLISDAHATCLVHGPAQSTNGHRIQTHKRLNVTFGLGQRLLSLVDAS